MSNLRYPYVFCDIDDTLLNDNRIITGKDKYEIIKYTSCGGIFILVTGRNYFAAKKIYDELCLQSPIIINQGCVFLPFANKWVYRKKINRGKLVELCEFLEKRNVYFQLFSDNDIFVKLKTRYAYNYIKNCGVSITETNMDLSRFLSASTYDIDKLMIECDESIVDKLFVQLRSCFGNSFAIEKSKRWIIEVSDPMNTKGEAVRHVLQNNGLEKNMCMAIGDSQSDLSMFCEVGFSVAVANAHNSVLSKAQKITRSNNEAGVGLALEQYAYEKILDC